LFYLVNSKPFAWLNIRSFNCFRLIKTRQLTYFQAVIRRLLVLINCPSTKNPIISNWPSILMILLMVFWFIWFTLNYYPNPVWLAYTCPLHAITTTNINAATNKLMKATSINLSTVLMVFVFIWLVVQCVSLTLISHSNCTVCACRVQCTACRLLFQHSQHPDEMLCPLPPTFGYVFW
jgi:hypothetical protein